MGILISNYTKMLCPTVYFVNLLHSPEAIQAQLVYGEGAMFFPWEALPDQSAYTKTMYSKSGEAFSDWIILTSANRRDPHLWKKTLHIC